MIKHNNRRGPTVTVLANPRAKSGCAVNLSPTVSVEHAMAWIVLYGWKCSPCICICDISACICTQAVCVCMNTNLNKIWLSMKCLCVCICMYALVCVYVWLFHADTPLQRWHCRYHTVTVTRKARADCPSTLKFKFKSAAAQHPILRNLPNKLVHFLLNKITRIEWPTSSFLHAPTAYICAVPFGVKPGLFNLFSIFFTLFIFPLLGLGFRVRV